MEFCMRFIFKFPDIGEGISEGKILEWYVQKGQHIKSGTSVVKMETDKVVADIPSPREGIIADIFGKIGDVIHVEDPLIEIEIGQVSIDEVQKITEAEKQHPTKATQEPLEEKGFGVVGTLEVAGDGAYLPASLEGRLEFDDIEENPNKKIIATPVARAMAKELGVDISKVIGTGPSGRVTKKDITEYFQHQYTSKSDLQQLRRTKDVTTVVMRKRQTVPIMPPDLEPKEIDSGNEQEAIENTDSTQFAIKGKGDSTQSSFEPSQRGVEIVQMTQIRKAIARRMTLSKENIPQMTVFEEVDISTLVELRKQQKQKFEERGIPLTYLPFIIKSLVIALKKHKAMNAQIDVEKGEIVYKHYYNIGIAVDAPDGLMVPVLRYADQLTIAELASEIQNLAAKARTRSLNLEDFRDGTFSITNYGGIAGLHAVPIINYPEVAILGIGRIRKMPIVQDNDQIKIGYIMPLSLSVDHRIVDGGEASRFLADIMESLKDPISLCLG